MDKENMYRIWGCNQNGTEGFFYVPKDKPEPYDYSDKDIIFVDGQTERIEEIKEFISHKPLNI